MKALWKNAVLAESDKTVVVEGNHYFPPDSINRAYFKANNTHTTCPWKGIASYYDIVVSGTTNAGATPALNTKSKAAQPPEHIPQPPCTIPRHLCNGVWQPGNCPRHLSTIARDKKSIPQPLCSIPRHLCNGVWHPGNCPRPLNTIARDKISILQLLCTIPRRLCNGVRHTGNRSQTPGEEPGKG